jgi:hypothetical protein
VKRQRSPNVQKPVVTKSAQGIFGALGAVIDSEVGEWGTTTTAIMSGISEHATTEEGYSTV